MNKHVHDIEYGHLFHSFLQLEEQMMLPAMQVYRRLTSLLRLYTITGLDWTTGLPPELKAQQYSSIVELTGAIT